MVQSPKATDVPELCAVLAGCPEHRKTFVDKKIAIRIELKKTELTIGYG